MCDGALRFEQGRDRSALQKPYPRVFLAHSPCDAGGRVHTSGGVDALSLGSTVGMVWNHPHHTCRHTGLDALRIRLPSVRVPLRTEERAWEKAALFGAWSSPRLSPRPNTTGDATVGECPFGDGSLRALWPNPPSRIARGVLCRVRCWLHRLRFHSLHDAPLGSPWADWTLSQGVPHEAPLR